MIHRMNGALRDMVERAVFFGVVAGATLLFAWMLSDFFMPIFGAVVLAILFHPLFARIARTMPHFPGIASILTIVCSLVLIGLPVYVLGDLLAREAVDTYRAVGDDPSGYFADSLDAIPALTAVLEQNGLNVADVRTRLAEGAQAISAGVFQVAAAATSGTISFVVKLVVALYLMFFFLKDGPRLVSTMTRIVPLRDEQVSVLFTRFSSTVRAVVKGGLIVALAQGLLGGALFWAVGIPQSALWGAVMAFLALIPLGGPALIWVPAAFLLFLSGQPVAAFVIVVGGVLLVGTVDNILRPFLVGRDTAMPDALILLSVIGGLATFGPGGIVIGPVVAALFVSVWEMFWAELTVDDSARA